MHQIPTRQSFGVRGVTVRANVFSQYRPALYFMIGTVTTPFYLNNTIHPDIVSLYEQHISNFIFKDDNAPAHQSRIIMERLPEIGVPRTEWLALSPDINSIKSLWGQINRCIDARNSVTQNPNSMNITTRFILSFKKH